MADLNRLLFFDIETHRVLEWEQLNPQIQRAFVNHYWDSDAYQYPGDHYKEIAGLHPEFSHVICVSFGYETIDGGFKVGHICTLDEKSLLTQFDQVCNTFFNQGYFLAGHNVFSCDIPYMAKRYIINELPVPEMISHIQSCKPWEAEELDTMNLWKMGMYRSTSLEMACACLGIPCKSEEISGSNLWTYPINEVPLDELATYCDEDVNCSYLIAKKVYAQL